MIPLWTDLAARANLTLSDAQSRQLDHYLDLLYAANERMNLTRITDRAAAESQHIGDALTLLPLLPPAAFKLADVGAGGGVPGIPLAIVRPDIQVALIEVTKKKAAFLRDAVATLTLGNATVIEQRAEDVGHSDERETFDVAVVRAVATMDWLVEWCLPLLKKDGRMLAMKGPKVADELPAAKNAIRRLHGGDPVVHPVQLPGAEHHVIVEITKLGRTDLKYPRLPTRAKGHPLS